MTISPAAAGNVKETPDPELLKRFEAERDAARAGQERARERIKRGEEKIRRGETKKRQALSELDAELCRMGALPATECP